MSIELERPKSGNYAIIRLQKEPVNAMDLPFWKQLSEVIQSLEQDPEIKGVIICSGLRKDIFTAGNDLSELYAPNTSFERYKLFWKTANTFLAKFLCSPLVTVAAIRGECPAGGHLRSSPFRFLVFLRIGLNEVGLGIPVPGYWGALFGKIIGFNKAKDLLLSGTLVPSSEALELGLVHETCSKELLLTKAEAYMMKALKLPLEGRFATKRVMFEDFSKNWIAALDDEAEFAFGFLSQPKNVAFMKSILKKLSNKNSKL